MDANRVLNDDKARKALESLSVSKIPDDVKKAIKKKFLELKVKYPKMKLHRVMRKAGNEYGIKFIFT